MPLDNNTVRIFRDVLVNYRIEGSKLDVYLSECLKHPEKIYYLDKAQEQLKVVQGLMAELDQACKNLET